MVFLPLNMDIVPEDSCENLQGKGAVKAVINSESV